MAHGPLGVRRPGGPVRGCRSSGLLRSVSLHASAHARRLYRLRVDDCAGLLPAGAGGRRAQRSSNHALGRSGCRHRPAVQGLGGGCASAGRYRCISGIERRLAFADSMASARTAGSGFRGYARGSSLARARDHAASALLRVRIRQRARPVPGLFLAILRQRARSAVSGSALPGGLQPGSAPVVLERTPSLAVPVERTAASGPQAVVRNSRQGFPRTNAHALLLLLLPIVLFRVDQSGVLYATCICARHAAPRQRGV